MKQKAFSSIVLVLVIGLLGVLGYFACKNYIQKLLSSSIPMQATQPGWKLFSNPELPFTFEFPSNPDWGIYQDKKNEGNVVYASCTKCLNGNITSFHISMYDPNYDPAIKTPIDFINRGKLMYKEDGKITSFLGVESAQYLNVGSTQAPTVVSIFTIHNGVRFIVSYSYNNKIINIKTVDKLPTSNPDILSTFKFIK